MPCRRRVMCLFPQGRKMFRNHAAEVVIVVVKDQNTITGNSPSENVFGGEYLRQVERLRRDLKRGVEPLGPARAGGNRDMVGPQAQRGICV